MVKRLVGGHTFKEWYKSNKATIFGIPSPFRDYQCVLWLGRDMLRNSVDHHDLGKVAIQI